MEGGWKDSSFRMLEGACCTRAAGAEAALSSLVSALRAAWRMRECAARSGTSQTETTWCRIGGMMVRRRNTRCRYGYLGYNAIDQ